MQLLINLLDAIEDRNISSIDLKGLIVIRDHEIIPMNILQDEMKTVSANNSLMCDRLENALLIERKASLRDRRSLFIKITKKGSIFMGKIERILNTPQKPAPKIVKRKSPRTAPFKPYRVLIKLDPSTKEWGICGSEATVIGKDPLGKSGNIFKVQIDGMEGFITETLGIGSCHMKKI